MNTLVRNTTLGLSRRGDDYEPLDQSGDDYDEKGSNYFSRPKYHHNKNQMNILHSVSYRLDRARKRHVFLQTYKLSPMNSSRKSVKTNGKLKKIVTKVTCLVSSIVRSCKSSSAICSTSPSRVMRCC
ncbi:hypothetical protein LIER_08145 [Lithospermum erythrorhizon]|uniref:Uncharacterized protein n=1 Tax=Lithospermum erythrorhizon TaxID=34254 RepID=A0AAV3PDN4_LITER